MHWSYTRSKNLLKDHSNLKSRQTRFLYHFMRCCPSLHPYSNDTKLKMTIIDLTIVGTYLLFSLFVGLRASRRVKTLKEYTIGSQQYSTAIIVVAIFSACLGGGLIFGLAQQAFVGGLLILLSTLSYALCFLIIARYIAPKMNRFCGMISVGDIVETHYGTEGKIVAGLISVFASIIVIAVQLIALAYTCYYFLDIPYQYGLVISLSIILIHATFGGIQSVTAANTFQLIVLTIAIPLISHISIQYIGGLDTFYHSMLEHKPEHIFAIDYPFIFLIFCFPLLMPATIQCLLMAKDSKQRRHSFYVSGFLSIPLIVSVSIIGIVAFLAEPSLPPMDAILYIFNTVLPTGSKGLALAGIFAIIISAANTHLNVATTCLVHDVFRPLRRHSMSENHELCLSRIATPILGGISLLIAMNFLKIIDMMLGTWGIWGSLMSAPLYAVLFKLTPNQSGFRVSVLAGIAVIVTWQIADLYNQWSIHSLLPGFFLSGFTLLCFSFNLQKRSYLKFTTHISTLNDAFKRLQVMCKNITINFLKLPSNLQKLCTIQSENFETKHILFSSFAILTFIFPYFVWQEIDVECPLSLRLWIIGGILCGSVLVKDYWSKSLQPLFNVCWHFTLLYCLPFLNTYMTLQSGAATFWLINLGLSLFLLAVILHWICFCAFLTLGIGAGIAMFKFTHIGTPWPLDTATIFLFAYLILFSAIIGIFLARNRAHEIENKHKNLRALSAAIAHEMRTPLSGLQLGVSGLSRYLPNLLHGYKLAKENELTIPHITQPQLKHARDVTRDFHNTIQKALLTIDMVLIKLRDPPRKPKQSISIAQCIDETLKEYPFLPHEKIRIDWKMGNDFTVCGHPEYIQHILLNLLKNSLRHIQRNQQGTISIWLTKGPTTNHIHFKDTALGFSEKELSHLFDSFKSHEPYTVETDLFFCKQVMNSMNGHIECTFVHRKYAQFTLKFPRQKCKKIEQNFTTTTGRNSSNHAA